MHGSKMFPQFKASAAWGNKVKWSLIVSSDYKTVFSPTSVSTRTFEGYVGQFFIEWDSLVHCRLTSILGLHPRRASPLF